MTKDQARHVEPPTALDIYNTFHRTIGCLLMYAIPQALECAILCLEDEVNLMMSSARISTELNP
jgi:hypothetical protein